jgi:hypothetical protein
MAACALQFSRIAAFAFLAEWKTNLHNPTHQEHPP